MSTSQHLIPESAVSRAEAARRAINRILFERPRAGWGKQDKERKALEDRARRLQPDLGHYLVVLLGDRPDDATTIMRIVTRLGLPTLDVLPFPLALAEETAAQCDADQLQINALRATAERRPLLRHERVQLRLSCARQLRALQTLIDTLDHEEVTESAS